MPLTVGVRAKRCCINQMPTVHETNYRSSWRRAVLGDYCLVSRDNDRACAQMDRLFAIMDLVFEVHKLEVVVATILA